jgi:hypothetical protein
MDRLLDEALSGPFYLRQPAIADMVVEAIQYNAVTPRTLSLYAFVVLHAFVVMPNHLHLLANEIVERYHEQTGERPIGNDGKNPVRASSAGWVTRAHPNKR